MRYDLAALVRRVRNPRRSFIVIRDIAPPATLATDLFRAIYLPVTQAWEQALPLIMAEYERTLSSLITDAPADVEQAVSSVAEQINRLLIVLTPELRRWAVRVEAWQRGKWRGAILSATDVDLLTLIGPEDARQTIDQTIAWNTSLVKDVSEQARQRIGNAVFSGLNERKPARDVAKQVREAVAMSRRRSINIASDQLSKLSSALASERRREAGISVFRHRHSGKLHPRQDHKARDGRLYSENPSEVGKSVGGQRVNAPVAADDRAGIPPFCGCREAAVLVFDFD